MGKNWVIYLFFGVLLCCSSVYGTVIVLTGTQSSGKSSIAAALKERLPGYHLISKDRTMQNKKKELRKKFKKQPIEACCKEWKAEMRKVKQRLRAELDEMREREENVIFDSSLNFYNDYGCPFGDNVLVVFLHSPIAVLEARELARASLNSKHPSKQLGRREETLSNYIRYFRPVHEAYENHLDILTREEILNFYLNGNWSKSDRKFNIADVLESLNLDLNPSVKIVPRFHYDISIDTGKHSVKESAQLVIRFLECGDSSQRCEKTAW